MCNTGVYPIHMYYISGFPCHLGIWEIVGNLLHLKNSGWECTKNVLTWKMTSEIIWTFGKNWNVWNFDWKVMGSMSKLLVGKWLGMKIWKVGKWLGICSFAKCGNSGCAKIQVKYICSRYICNTHVIYPKTPHMYYRCYTIGTCMLLYYDDSWHHCDIISNIVPLVALFHKLWLQWQR